MYEVGDLGRFTVTFRDPDTDALVDPSSIVFKYKTPLAVQTSVTFPDDNLVKLSEGQYRTWVSLGEPGVWTFRWETTGSHQAAAEFLRNVTLSRFDTPQNTVAPAVSGSGTVGQTLSCSTGTWTRNPTGYAYQWLRDGVAIPGATTGTYLLVLADYTTDVSCQVTATNDSGDTAATSNAVTVDVPVPINTALPLIAAANEIPGAILTATTGTWTASSSPVFAYQWVHCDASGNNPVDIGGAASATYPLTEADIDFTIRVRVTATDIYGSASAMSLQTAAVHFPSQNIFISPLIGSTANTNWSTISQSTDSFFSGLVTSSGAQNASIDLEFYAEEGTYTLDLLHRASTSLGIYTILIDGVELGTKIDGYSTTGGGVRGSIANVAITTTGVHTLRLLMSDKNSASSNYTGSVSAVALTRTA